MRGNTLLRVQAFYEGNNSIVRSSASQFGSWLEAEFERHLNLPRAADSLVHDPQSAQRGRRVQRRTVDRKIVEEQILRYVVHRNVETGGIGHVEHIEAESHGDPLRELRHPDRRDVRPPLPGLTEDVSLSRCEIRFKCV